MLGVDVMEIFARHLFEGGHDNGIGGAEPFLQIALDALQRRRLPLLNGVELRFGQADRAARRVHRVLVGLTRPCGCIGAHRARQKGSAGGGNHSAARDRVDRNCHALVFLAAGNVISAVTYRKAAQSRTRLNPSSRAITLASGVATTENAPFRPQAQGRKPPEPVRARPRGNGRPRAKEAGASVNSTSNARASHGRSSVPRISDCEATAITAHQPTMTSTAIACARLALTARRSANMLPMPENTSMPVNTGAKPEGRSFSHRLACSIR